MNKKIASFLVKLGVAKMKAKESWDKEYKYSKISKKVDDDDFGSRYIESLMRRGTLPAGFSLTVGAGTSKERKKPKREKKDNSITNLSDFNYKERVKRCTKCGHLGGDPCLRCKMKLEAGQEKAFEGFPSRKRGTLPAGFDPDTPELKRFDKPELNTKETKELRKRGTLPAGFKPSEDYV